MTLPEIAHAKRHSSGAAAEIAGAASTAAVPGSDPGTFWIGALRNRERRARKLREFEIVPRRDAFDLLARGGVETRQRRTAFTGELFCIKLLRFEILRPAGKVAHGFAPQRPVVAREAHVTV